jgi:type II secretory pathway pseudopilin PulG
MKKLIVIALVAFLGSIVAPSALQAQAKQKKNVDAKSAVFEKTRGADENIKTAKPGDDTPKAKVEKTRGESCYIYVNNYTGYSIDIYVDGDWMGTIAAYATAYTTTYPGNTKFYAKSIGGTRYWGPSYFDCQYEYTWNLYE